MKKNDTMENLRKLKYLPDVTPLCGILIIIVVIFMIPGSQDLCRGPVIDLPNAKYAHAELNNVDNYNNDKILEIAVDAERRIFLGISHCIPIEVDGPFKLPIIVRECMDKWHIQEKKKVLFYADGDIPWGKVSELLRILKNEGIEASGLVTEINCTVLDYVNIRTLYREKGLKEPNAVK